MDKEPKFDEKNSKADEPKNDIAFRAIGLRTGMGVRPFPETLSKKLVQDYASTIDTLMQKIQKVKVFNAFDSFTQKSESLVDTGAIDRLREQKKILVQDIHTDAKQLIISVRPSFDLELKLLEEEQNLLVVVMQLFDLESRVEYLNPEARVAILENLIDDLRREKDFIDGYKHMFATADPKSN
ncbi:MAG: hypothetical protein KBC98_01065 [Candidatus Pacebacteria bacterium]|jgi:hypothetical protein|nr:hypothetical protein [Candidatus Paceibacterota bacterium]